MRPVHLHDDRLLEHYAAVHTGGPLDRPTAEHLTACGECGARYAALVELLGAIPTDAAAEADEVFTSDRLRRQQQQVLRRLEHMGHPARVLSFPGRIGKTIGGRSLTVAPRWLAAAAAAGLFVGVAVGGAFFEGGLRNRTMLKRSSGAQAPSLMSHSGAGPTTAPPANRDGLDDDAFLSDLELALEWSSPGELLPFDALTPHLLGVRTVLR